MVSRSLQEEVRVSASAVDTVSYHLSTISQCADRGCHDDWQQAKMFHDEIYDAIIVGSGAAGGMAAYELCRAGLKVLLLEAGRDCSNTETAMFSTPERAPLRRITVDKPGGYYDATVSGGWAISGEPYTVAEGSDEFRWWRPRMLGGARRIGEELLCDSASTILSRTVATGRRGSQPAGESQLRAPQGTG